MKKIPSIKQQLYSLQNKIEKSSQQFVGKEIEESSNFNAPLVQPLITVQGFEMETSTDFVQILEQVPRAIYQMEPTSRQPPTASEMSFK